MPSCFNSRSAIKPPNVATHRSLIRPRGMTRFWPIYMTERERWCDLRATINLLPRGAIVVLREYGAPDRLEVARQLRRLTRAKGMALLIAEDARLAHRIRADGVHLPSRALRGRSIAYSPVVSAACHSRTDLARAVKRAIPLKLVSPVFATRSHVGARTLGPHRFARLTRGVEGVIALGGVTRDTVKVLAAKNLAGIAAIDGWHNKIKG